MIRWLIKAILLSVVTVVTACVLGVVWLRWDAYQPLDGYFAERQGDLIGHTVTEATLEDGQIGEFLTLESDSGLSVRIRVIRRDSGDAPLPTLIVLGGHRTGSDAVELFGQVGDRAIIAMDYPYDGPEKVRGVRQTIGTLPLARRAFIDTPPAVSLALDWLSTQSWADLDQVTVVGASLGVPFAALVTARDPRVSGAVLVHGAADNLAWIEVQVARRNDNPLAVAVLTQLLYWLSYGPTFETGKNVALISPRPVIIVGAREDERTPPAQVEALFAAAGEPKQLRWTSGQHVETDRPEVIAELLAIADEIFGIPATR